MYKGMSRIYFNGSSIGIFGPQNRLRLCIANMLENPYFEEFIYCLIGINSLLLAMDEPVLLNPYSKTSIRTMVDVITFVYIGECLLKIIAMGFCMGPHAYLKDAFNKFDFTIVVLSIVTFSIDNSGMDQDSVNLGWAKAFRALRALRPLKLVSKNEGMKIVVNSLLNSFPNLMNVMMIMLLFYSVFAILAVQLLAGKCSYCSVDPYLEGNDMEFCLSTGGTWITPPNNYNHFGYAM
jgi:hypothetical protein